MDALRQLLLVDDHVLVRRGLQLLLQASLPGLAVSVAGSLQAACARLAAAPRCELVLLDLTLEDVHGMAGLRRLRDEFPQVPVLVLSAQDDRDTVRAALDSGAMGFLSKAAPPQELVQALREVLHERRVHLPQARSPRAAPPPDQGRPLGELRQLGLTQRQLEVLSLVVQGLRNKDIARRLDISEVMVKKHITPVLQALGVHDRTQLLVTLGRHGYRVPRLLAEPGP